MTTRSRPDKENRITQPLAGLRTRGHPARPIGHPAFYWPSLPNSVESVLDDGGRFRLPLRGSPGLTPGSLFVLQSLGSNQQRGGLKRSSCGKSTRLDNTPIKYDETGPRTIPNSKSTRFDTQSREFRRNSSLSKDQSSRSSRETDSTIHTVWEGQFVRDDDRR